MRTRHFFAPTALILIATLLGAGCSSTAAPRAPAPSAAVAPSNTATVSISEMVFQPPNLTVAAGTTVTWTNHDSVPHTVTADDGSFDSGTLKPGASFSHTFKAGETTLYHCFIHSSMHGGVLVQ